MRSLMLIMAPVFAAGSAFALGPHELAIIANRNSPRSVELAREYSALRRVPEINIVEVALPEATWQTGLEITAEDFGALIWEPVTRTLSERGLDRQILAWAYSIDFPTRVRGTPPMSIQGLTFLRNRLPASELVDKGTYVSPLFAGPDEQNHLPFATQSLDAQAAWLGPDMPLPSMMLGFAGAQGNSLEDIRAALQRGVAADGARPDGVVYFLAGEDLRAKIRQWLFPVAVAELQAAGIRALLTNGFPDGADGVIGILAGAAVVDPRRIGSYRPGCAADHLTSFGAAFDMPDQTKVTAWIAAGATVTAGVVTEPFSRWPKFPNARLFSHAAAGCTWLESYFQSIRCPLQILLLGDPLCAPWAPKDSIRIVGLDKQPIRTAVTVRVEPVGASAAYYGRYAFLVDGRLAAGPAREALFRLDPARYAPGPHRLRAVAYRSGSVRMQVFAEQSFEVSR